jgi:hypothetical protein
MYKLIEHTYRAGGKHLAKAWALLNTRWQISAAPAGYRREGPPASLNPIPSL